MESPDNYNEIAASLLFSDVELGLTFVRVGLSYPEGERRRTAINRAEAAYNEICELKSRVQMTNADCMELSGRLQELHQALQQVSR